MREKLSLICMFLCLILLVVFAIKALKQANGGHVLEAHLDFDISMFCLMLILVIRTF